MCSCGAYTRTRGRFQNHVTPNPQEIKAIFRDFAKNLTEVRVEKCVKTIAMAGQHNFSYYNEENALQEG